MRKEMNLNAVGPRLRRDMLPEQEEEEEVLCEALGFKGRKAFTFYV